MKNLVVAVLFAGSLSIFGAANAADGCGLVAIIRRMADVSSMAGIPAGSYGTSALPELGPVPRAETAIWRSRYRVCFQK